MHFCHLVKHSRLSTFSSPSFVLSTAGRPPPLYNLGTRTMLLGSGQASSNVLWRRNTASFLDLPVDSVMGGGIGSRPHLESVYNAHAQCRCIINKRCVLVGITLISHLSNGVIPGRGSDCHPQTWILSVNVENRSWMFSKVFNFFI